MRVNRAVVPSIFTVLNLVCGFFSIIHSADDKFVIASWLIILAAVFDSLDGIMARLTRSTSEFGVELDSLADVISFGAAPSFLVYRLNFHFFDGFGILLSALFLICCALRLARFNVQLVGFNKKYFSGFPAPSAAITLTSFVILFCGETGLSSVHKSVLIPLVMVLSFLMISTIRYETIPAFTRRSIKKHPVKFGLFVTGLVLMVATAGKAIFPLFALMIVLGVLRSVIWTIRHIILHVDAESEEEAEVTSFDI
jgi:CDP-diacylglycerol--serine O-phosphatidyltransferase